MIKPEILEQELNRLYKTDAEEYKKDCDFWKNKGYKIYRNSDGIHKVVINSNATTKSAMKDIFGGTFEDTFNSIFGG